MVTYHIINKSWANWLDLWRLKSPWNKQWSQVVSMQAMLPSVQVALPDMVPQGRRSSLQSCCLLTELHDISWSHSSNMNTFLQTNTLFLASTVFIDFMFPNTAYKWEALPSLYIFATNLLGAFGHLIYSCFRWSRHNANSPVSKCFTNKHKVGYETVKLLVSLPGDLAQAQCLWQQKAFHEEIPVGSCTALPHLPGHCPSPSSQETGLRQKDCLTPAAREMLLLSGPGCKLKYVLPVLWPELLGRTSATSKVIT